MRRVPRPPPASHPDHPGVIAPVPIDPKGKDGPTPGQARGPRWRRTSAGLYVPADVDSERVEQRIAEVAAEISWGGVTGWASLCWRRARWFDGSDGRPVVLAISSRNLRPDDRRVPSKEGMRPGDLELVDGVWTTSAVRSVCYEVRHAPSLGQAVQHLDMACHCDLVSLDECRTFERERLQTWTGVPQLRTALLLADENAWSPPEVTMRLTWVGAGHDRPLTNRPLFDLHGRHIATPDLLDPVAGVAGEYEGAVHFTGAARAKDLVREDEIRAHGLEVVTMVGPDLADPAAFLARLRAAYARAAARPVSGRTWTVVQPAWWLPTETVEQRRALSDDDRARLLGHRRA